MKRVRNDTTCALSKHAHDIIAKWSEIHNRKISDTLENLCFLIESGIDGINEWTIEDLRKEYQHSTLAVFADVRTMFPVNGTEGD